MHRGQGRLSASGDGSATSLQLTLALAQLHLVKGNVNDACSLLRSLDETSRFQLAMVSGAEDMLLTFADGVSRFLLF